MYLPPKAPFRPSTDDPPLIVTPIGQQQTYEGDVVKRFMNLVALQPLVVDEAFMPHMKAMDVPFHTMYGSLICFKGLQSDRPKC